MQRTILSLIFSLLLLSSPSAWGGGVKTVEGEARFVMPKNMTLLDAENHTIFLAQIDALNREFGNTVGYASTSITTNYDDEFYANGFQYVKGEWVETIGEPKVETKANASGDIVIYVKIKGKARAKASANTQLQIKVLRNGTNASAESSEFRNGNNMYMSFTSPVDGYVLIAQSDPVARRVYILLPYRRDGRGSVPVKHNREYLFFDPEHPTVEGEAVDKMKVTCGDKPESNTLFVMFSPNRFAKPVTGAMPQSRTMPINLPIEEFEKWKTECMLADDQLQVETRDIKILP